MGAVASSAPLVSVITIFLDAREFFCEAVESVIGQTYPNWELLLVDDGSTDGTTMLARDYVSRHPDRIRYFEHSDHGHRGMSASRNVGVRHARGELIGFLDADDVWMRDKLDVQLGLLASSPHAAMVTGTTRLWYGWTGRAEDEARDAIRTVSDPADGLCEPPELLCRFLIDRALTPATCSVLIRREAVSKIGGFEERFPGLYEDQAFFLKAYLTLPILLTARCTDLYRQHPNSHSAEALRTGRYSADAPSAALIDLFLWLTRYLVSRRVVDRVVWARLLQKLIRLGSNRAMTAVNRPAKRMLAWWHGAKTSRGPESGDGRS